MSAGLLVCLCVSPVGLLISRKCDTFFQQTSEPKPKAGPEEAKAKQKPFSERGIQATQFKD